SIRVALRALQRRMCTGQRESGRGVVEGRVAPVGIVVALLTSLGEVGLHVVGVGRTLVILEVAANAGGVGRRQIVAPVHVALGALQRSVRSDQRETGSGVVKGRIGP